MERVLRSKTVWWVGGALIVGTALALLNRALDPNLDWDIWEDAYKY